LAEVDRIWFEANDSDPTWTSLDRLVAALSGYRAYMIEQIAIGVPISSMTRHMLGLFQGLPGARVFRRDLSDQQALRAQGINWFDASLARFLTVQRTAAT
jgi:tRNA-dihydrouridine synthase A